MEIFKLYIKALATTYLISVIIGIIFNVIFSQEKDIMQSIPQMLLALPVVIFLGASLVLPMLQIVVGDMFVSSPAERDPFFQSIIGGPYTIFAIFITIVIGSILIIKLTKKHPKSKWSLPTLVVMFLVWEYVFASPFILFGVTA